MTLTPPLSDAPLAPGADHGESVDPALFREAMSRVASPVHVITTSGPSGLAGFTATAVASVSDAPPMLLVCVKHDGASASAITENGAFAVHTLGADQIALADRFAGRGGHSAAERFAGLDYALGLTGAPLLATALAVFECRLTEAQRHGSHLVCFGQVVQVLSGGEGASLLYARRGYRTL